MDGQVIKEGFGKTTGSGRSNETDARKGQDRSSGESKR